MRQNNTSILFFLSVVICLFSCKKDKDDYGPAITFSSPNENQFFNVNDVVQVKASISDETQITAVSISLVDANLNPAHISLEVPVKSPSMTVNAGYELDNIHLESGVYYILITASDGKNDSYTYRKIYIGAIPKVIQKIMVASATSSAQTNFSSIDSSFSALVPYKTFTGDYIGSSVSSYFQQAYMCGNYSGAFTGIKLSDNSIQFSVPPIVSSSPYFTGYHATDKINYVARYDEFVRGYDQAGTTVYSASAETGFYIQHFCFNNSYLVAEEKDKTSSTKKLLTCYPTGSQQQSVALSQDVVAFCEKDVNNLFLFGNSSGQGVIQLFDRINNYIWNPYPSALATGTILSAVKIDADTYLIGHSNGTIYKYTYQSPGVITYLTGYTALQLKYDFDSNRLFIAEQNRISSIDYPSTTLISSVNSAEPVLDIHLLYNR